MFRTTNVFVLKFLVIFGAASVSSGAVSFAGESETLMLQARTRASDKSREESAAIQSLRWDPRKTAIVICDMWDQHWCRGATARVAEMAPRMNEVVSAARKRGVLIIHCPSSCMAAYQDTPMRKLAQSAPQVATRVPLQPWCKIDLEHEAALPIDDGDGGCDCWPPCPHGSPWKRQIATIDIQEGDAITDNAEAYFLMKQRGIDNVIVMGVHTNMCVLGRPFSIRQMVYQGQNVVLMRDMTDTMYNSRRSPFVPHVEGTRRVIEHIEKYWCPTIESTDFTGKPAFRFAEADQPHVVIVIGEDEYKTWETLPRFADEQLKPLGLRCTIVHADAEDGNDFRGIEALKTADLLMVSVRRRSPKADQLAVIREYAAAGKPIIGIRTANHAFHTRGKHAEGLAEWQEFDRDVLGGNYTGHHGNGLKTTIAAADSGRGHPVLDNVSPVSLVGNGSLYKVSPLAKTAQPLLVGSIPGQSAEPVAWTHSYGNSRVFYTSLGHPDDFRDPEFRRLLTNAVFWALGKPRAEKPGSSTK